MATAQYTYHPYHTIGAATVLIWDPAAVEGSGAWQVLGRVADASINVVTEQVGKEIVIKGLSQPIARRNRAKRHSLSFRMLENANPATLDLLFGDGAQQSSLAGGLKATSEVLRLYGEEYVELSHPYGIPENALDNVVNMLASASGSGGSIPPGSYFYWVSPVIEDPGKPGLQGTSSAAGPISVGSGEVVTITFIPPPGYTPDKYRTYYNTTSDLASAQLIDETDAGPPIVITNHIEIGEYEGPAAPLVQLWAMDGLVPYLAGTDYSVNVTSGLLKRLAGGAIGDGQRVLAVYAYHRSAGVETALGDSVALERYRRIKLLQLAPDGSDPASWRETGLEFLFYKVNASVNDSSFAFADEEFGEGIPVTWDCLYDGEQGKVGTLRSSFDVLASY